MSTLREAAQQALEALRLNNDEWKALADSGDCGNWTAESQDHYKQTNAVIAALEAALAQEQAEPSGYCTLEQLVVMQRTVPSPDKIAIYTTPPKAEPAQEPLVWEPVVRDLPALTQREYDALHKDLRWNYKRITPPKVEPKFLDTVLYTGSSERVTTVSPITSGVVGVVPITTVSVTTQHRVLTDADLDAIRKIVREGGKE